MFLNLIKSQNVSVSVIFLSITPVHVSVKLAVTPECLSTSGAVLHLEIKSNATWDTLNSNSNGLLPEL